MIEVSVEARLGEPDKKTALSYSFDISVVTPEYEVYEHCEQSIHILPPEEDDCMLDFSDG